MSSWAERFPEGPLKLSPGAQGSPVDLPSLKWLWLASLEVYKHPGPLAKTLEGWQVPPERWQFFDLDSGGSHTQGFLAHGDEEILVSFRGTEPLSWVDWATDARFELVPGPFGRVHRGFSQAICGEDSEVLRATQAALHERPGVPLYLTGHSLGGALSVLLAAQLVEAGLGSRVAAIVTFGQPRVGDQDFAQALDQALPGRLLRVVHGRDLVASLPPTEAELDAVGGRPRWAREVDLGFVHGGLEWVLTPGPKPKRKPPPLADPRFDMHLERGIAKGIAPWLGKLPGFRELFDHMRSRYHLKLWCLDSISMPQAQR